MAPTEAVLLDRPPEKAASPLWRQLFHWHFAVLLAIMIFFGAIRWRLADMPLERDEAEYAYAGQLMLQGIPPYQLVYNMKLPGTYTVYAAILAAFGETARGIHIGFLLVNALSIILVYLLTARLFGTLAGTIAAASYAFLSTNPGVFGFSAHATHFVLLAALIGLLLLVRAEATRSTAMFFGCGLAFGVAYLMKQPGSLFGAFAFLYLALRCWPKTMRDWTPWARQMIVLLFGEALPFAATCALLYRAGVFRSFWFWTFSYARQYVGIVPLSAGWALLKASSSYILSSTTPWLWLLALMGIPALFCDRAVRRHAGLVLGLTVFSFAAVCPGLYFRPHHFILFMPAVAILIAVAVTSTSRALSARFSARWLGFIPAMVFVIAFAASIHRNATFYFRLTPVQACRVCYPGNPFPEAVQVADYLRQHTAPTDKIMVFGSEPEIYFDAHRHSASGYIYAYSLAEDQHYWPVMQQQMMHEVDANHPAYVVEVNISFSWLLDPLSPQAVALRSWMKQYLASNFEEVGMVELTDAEAHYFWGDEARAHHLPGHEILIFKRKG